MALKSKPGRDYIGTREAADIFGVTMGRIRQLALSGELWCDRLHGRALVFDKCEVERKAKVLPSTGRPRKGHTPPPSRSRRKGV